jgi:hypothetical protein
MITPAVVANEPTSLAAVHDQCAAIEAWAEACESVPELRDASNKLAAIDTYLERTSIEGRARTAAAMRRLEVRIGQLLGPAEKGRPSNGNVPREQRLPGNRRHDFRQMAEHEDVVEEVIADSTDENPASRRKVTEAIRRRRQPDTTEVEPRFKGSVKPMKPPAQKAAALGSDERPPRSSADDAGGGEQAANTRARVVSPPGGRSVGSGSSDTTPGPSTDPTQGEGVEGAAAEGDVDPATAVVDDGSQGHDLGRSAPEPTPAWQGPGGRAGSASVGAPAGPGPSLDVAGMVHALGRVPDPDAEVVATSDLRVLVAWCQRQLAHRGFEDPHERCREHLAHMQRLLDEARAAA